MLKWNCFSCGNKLFSRKEKILKTCDNCASRAKQTIEAAKNHGDAALLLMSQLGSNRLKRKDKKTLVKTLSNPNKRELVFIKWHKQELSTAAVTEELKEYVDESLLNEIVIDYNAFIVKSIYEEEKIV